MTVLDARALFLNRVEAVRSFHHKTGIQKAELDISGGIDSALMLCILVEALGVTNVIVVHSRIDTDRAQTQRAIDLANALGVELDNADFGGAYGAMLRAMYDSIERAHGHKELERVEARIEADPTILGSIRSCLRAPIGRGFNRLLGGGLRHGTGNECEDRFLRFYQKGGDGEVDTNPLAMLTKTEVFQLSWYIGQEMEIAHAMDPILRATPSPDLWGTGDGHSDEAELLSWTGAPFTYGRINVETGNVTQYGTIEIISRLLDTQYPNTEGNPHFFEEWLFQKEEPDRDNLLRFAEDNVGVAGFDPVLLQTLLKAARWAERVTRHKENPNIPTLGDRGDLVEQGILDDNVSLED